MDDVVILLAEMAALLFILGIGCIVADYIFPHIRPLQRWLESLPEWDDDEDY
jgi:hypothetical protein